MAVANEDLCDRVPESNRWKLDCKIDFEHGGLPKHLDTIAGVMDEWEGGVATALGLVKVDVTAIKTEHKDKLILQTRAALQLWHEKSGPKATYRNLINIFLEAKKVNYAEAVCQVLISNPEKSGSQNNSVGNHQQITPTKRFDEVKKHAVKLNEDKIKQSFAKLVYQVRNVLTEQAIDMEGFHTFLANLFVGKQIPLLDEIAKIFVFIAQNSLWNYSHYSPLASIAEEFAKSQTQPHLASYKQQLGGFYSTTKLLEYIEACQEGDEEADPKVPLKTEKFDREYYRKLTVKLERRITNETLQYIDDLWRALAEFFVLPSLTALLDSVVSGSLIVTWWIPWFAADKLKTQKNDKGDKAESFYRRHEIVEVKIDDSCLYMQQADSDQDQHSADVNAKDEGGATDSKNDASRMQKEENKAPEKKRFCSRPYIYIDTHSDLEYLLAVLGYY